MNDIDALISEPHFTVPQRDHEARLLPVLKGAFARDIADCLEVGRLALRQRWDLQACSSIDDLPFIPVSAFKHRALRCVPESAVTRELRSSGTTGGNPSRIYLDKTTAFRQARALGATLQQFLGTERRPFVVADVPAVLQGAQALTARGAAIAGLSSFGSEVVFALRGDPDNPEPDLDAIAQLGQRFGSQRVLVFGFTFMIHQYLVDPLHRADIRVALPDADVLHSGGWKKLTELRVDKATFSHAVAQRLGCDVTRVRDFYGMVEQVGVVFIDCDAGNKHCPPFAEVVIRHPLTMRRCAVGEVGLIEVLSALPSSYPGHGLLTEDQGVVLGIDDCPCGKLGQYFRFTERVARTELRGCGDTHAQQHNRPAETTP